MRSVRPGRGRRISLGARRSAAPRALPGLPDPSGPRAALYGDRRESAYSRQYGGGSSLGAVTSPTSLAPERAGGWSFSLPTPLAVSTAPAPPGPTGWWWEGPF